MDLNPICHPSPAKKWNAHFWITFNFWWSAGLVDGLEPHLPPLSSQKYEILIFGLRSTPVDWSGCLMDSKPICHPSPAKKWNAHFGLRSTSDDRPGWSMDSNPICYPLQPKIWNAHFGLHSCSDDQPGWSMDSNPICHPSPAKNMKCSFWITFIYWWSAGLVDGLKPHLPPLSSQKMKCSFLDYVQLLMISQARCWTRTPSATPFQPKNEMLIFWLHSTSDDQLGWSMDSNPITHPSPANKMKCSFLDYIQLLVISQAIQAMKVNQNVTKDP